jgi:N-acetylglucosamine-6-phosphate deacetylase
MPTTVLRSAHVLSTADARWVAFDGGTIVDVGSGDAPSDAHDLGDAILAPGFVDIQVNGIGDVDFSRTDTAGYRRAAERLVRHGVTTFLPTLISAPMDTYAPAIERLAVAGAFGVHLEGPFLGGARGAHRADYLRDSDTAWMRELLAGPGGNLVRVVTLSPERDPKLELTRMLAGAGVVVSLGHSTATYDESRAAVDAGARAVTHLFNGMGPLHHREPGLAGAALDDDRLTPSLIADLVHVHPVSLKLAALRKRNVALVSDSVAAEAEWAASRGIRVLDGAPRLEDGTLAGSVLTMDVAIRNMVSVGIPISRAVEMASTIPAELLGLDDHGKIRPGARADLVALDRGDLSVRAVWRDGERVS